MIADKIFKNKKQNCYLFLTKNFFTCSNDIINNIYLRNKDYKLSSKSNDSECLIF